LLGIVECGKRATKEMEVAQRKQQINENAMLSNTNFGFKGTL